MSELQSRSNHVRLDPKFQFILVPVWLLLVILSVVIAVHALHNGGSWILAIWTVFLTLMLGYVAAVARIYALKVQDRVIRMEERLRMASLLPEELKRRISELSEDQLIGLRFASDGELAERVRETLEQRLTRSQIKDRVQQWRPDNWRV